MVQLTEKGNVCAGGVREQRLIGNAGTPSAACQHGSASAEQAATPEKPSAPDHEGAHED